MPQINSRLMDYLGIAVLLSILCAGALAWKYDGAYAKSFFDFLTTLGEYLGAAIGVTGVVGHLATVMLNRPAPAPTTSGTPAPGTPPNGVAA